jgi:hypothetical protein
MYINVYKEILLAYYFNKLLQDYGHSTAPTGFELRSSLKLSKHIPMNGTADVSDPLTLDQVVYGKWLMAVLRVSNHEFKWNTHIMITNLMKQWRKSASSIDLSQESS